MWFTRSPSTPSSYNISRKSQTVSTRSTKTRHSSSSFPTSQTSLRRFLITCCSATPHVVPRFSSRYIHRSFPTSRSLSDMLPLAILIPSDSLHLHHVRRRNHPTPSLRIRGVSYSTHSPHPTQVLLSLLDTVELRAKPRPQNSQMIGVRWSTSPKSRTRRIASNFSARRSATRRCGPVTWARSESSPIVSLSIWERARLANIHTLVVQNVANSSRST